MVNEELHLQHKCLWHLKQLLRCVRVLLVVPHAMQQNQHLEVDALFTQAMPVAITAVYHQSAVF